MQNDTDISALLHNPRNIYIAIAGLTFIVAFVSALRMPAYMGIMALVAWLLWLSITGKTAKPFKVEAISGVLSDVTPFPQARAVTIAGYPNSGNVDGATRFMVAGRPVYMKTLAPLKAGDVVVTAVIPNGEKNGPLSNVPFEALALRDESRTEAEGRWLFIPDARMQVPSGWRLWAVVAMSVFLIGLPVPDLCGRRDQEELRHQIRLGACHRGGAPPGRSGRRERSAGQSDGDRAARLSGCPCARRDTAEGSA